MKKLFKKWLIFVGTISSIIFIAQIIVFILLKINFQWGWNGPIGSRVFFVILIVLVVLCIIVTLVFNKKNNRVLHKNQFWQTEEDIGYEVMEKNTKIMDEKTGFVHFNNQLKTIWILINSINIVLAVIFAIILQLS